MCFRLFDERLLGSQNNTHLFFLLQALATTFCQLFFLAADELGLAACFFLTPLQLRRVNHWLFRCSSRWSGSSFFYFSTFKTGSTLRNALIVSVSR